MLFTKPADNTFIPFYSRRSWTEWGTVEYCAAAVWTGPNLVSVAQRERVMSIALHFRVWTSNYYRGIRITVFRGNWGVFFLQTAPSQAEMQCVSWILQLC